METTIKGLGFRVQGLHWTRQTFYRDYVGVLRRFITPMIVNKMEKTTETKTESWIL